MDMTPAPPATQLYVVEFLTNVGEHFRWRGPIEASDDHDANVRAGAMFESMYRPAGAARFRIFRQVSLWPPDSD